MESDRTVEFVRQLTTFSRRIFSYILTLVPNHVDAEEVFQETSATLWEKFDEFEPGSSFGAWACRIAYFKTLNFRSRQKYRPVTFSDAFVRLVDAEMIHATDTLDYAYRALADCYAKLSAQDRDLIDRKYDPGSTTSAIATALGRSHLWVYRALSRIHQQLLKCVSRVLADEGRL
jgi:RNA polymerase sigma-70 factor (ECF subfamily)